MKQFLLLHLKLIAVILFAAILFTSCNGNDNIMPPDKPDIIVCASDNNQLLQFNARNATEVAHNTDITGAATTTFFNMIMQRISHTSKISILLIAFGSIVCMSTWLDPPNNGTLVEVGDLKVNVTGMAADL